MQFLPGISQATNAVVNITTGGGHGMTLEERLAAPLRAKPEMCSLNMGSMNFGLYPMLERYKEWKYEWEPKALEMTRDFIFRNTFADIEKVIKRLGEECGTRFEHECYDVGHLYNLAHFVDRGLIKPPLFVQTIFGILGGIGADHENLLHMKRIADKLFGDEYAWSILAAGRHQMPFVTMGAIMGGNVGPLTGGDRLGAARMMMCRELIDPPMDAAERQIMRRQHQRIGRQRVAEFSERAQIAHERIALGLVRRHADIGRNLRQDLVAGDQDAGLGAIKRRQFRGMPFADNDP